MSVDSPPENVLSCSVEQKENVVLLRVPKKFCSIQSDAASRL